MSADQATRLTDVGGVYKRTPADFQVKERLPFAPEGDGEHVYLHIRKHLHNTLDVQRLLAELAAVPRHHVGYAGLKDRFAVTEQWFSVHLPGSGEPDWSVLEAQAPHDGELQLLAVTRHRKKLRIGAHSGNDFALRAGSLTGDIALLSAALEQIQQQGFPNFFGEQRFGIERSNLDGVASFGNVRKGRLSKRQQMVLSAVRAALFNEVLSERLARGCWCQPVDGDLLKLEGSNSFFGPVAVDDALCARAAALDVHPTGPLAGGTDQAAVTEDAAALESAVLARHADYRALLARVGVKPARRALRACARGLHWQQQGAELHLQFSLDRGVYATELLRYLGAFVQWREPV